jgi:hypothetical protein
MTKRTPTRPPKNIKTKIIYAIKIKQRYLDTNARDFESL